ncbi:MAG TPA: hypothetical protein IAB25_01520 [Candidatus Coproplasma stercoravium]|nr:hypothetical protein [Candidatus Coproplasma stercoravium]
MGHHAPPPPPPRGPRRPYGRPYGRPRRRRYVGCCVPVLGALACIGAIIAVIVALV